MRLIRYLWHWTYRLTRHNHDFLLLIKMVESLVSKVLSLFMIGIIFFALYDIGFFLIQEWFHHSENPLKTRLFDAFGLFLNVLIALELLDNITAYLKNHVIQLELVIVTAMIAIARKIIIFDLENQSPDALLSISIAVLLLSISYYFVSRQKTNKHH